MKSNPNSAAIAEAKQKFSELFSKTNPRLYEFLGSMVDGSIGRGAEVPRMSERDMEQMARAIANIAASPARKEIFATEATRTTLLKTLNETTSEVVREVLSQVERAMRDMGFQPATQPLPRSQTPATSSLETLLANLRQTKPAAAKKIAASVVGGNAVTSINLWRDQISDAGATALAEALKHPDW